jgi:hypothetical protein
VSLGPDIPARANDDMASDRLVGASTRQTGLQSGEAGEAGRDHTDSPGCLKWLEGVLSDLRGAIELLDGQAASAARYSCQCPNRTVVHRVAGGAFHGCSRSDCGLPPRLMPLSGVQRSRLVRPEQPSTDVRSRVAAVPLAPDCKPSTPQPRDALPELPRPAG